MPASLILGILDVRESRERESVLRNGRITRNALLTQDESTTIHGQGSTNRELGRLPNGWIVWPPHSL